MLVKMGSSSPNIENIFETTFAPSSLLGHNLNLTSLKGHESEAPQQLVSLLGQLPLLRLNESDPNLPKSFQRKPCNFYMSLYTLPRKQTWNLNLKRTPPFFRFHVAFFLGVKVMMNRQNHNPESRSTFTATLSPAKESSRDFETYLAMVWDTLTPRR